MFRAHLGVVRNFNDHLVSVFAVSTAMQLIRVPAWKGHYYKALQKQLSQLK